jgi:HlyD family secretion protein
MVLTALAVPLFMQWRSNATGPRLVAATPNPLLPPTLEAFVAAPGRVEPVSEEIEVGTEISGKIKAVLVDEGDQMQQGQHMAILENRDYAARLAAAEARLAQAQAELRRVMNGARSQERREARAVVEQTESVMWNAELELARRQWLLQHGAISKEEADRAERDLRVARARNHEAKERHALIDAAAREEDRARAQATVALARAQVSEARAHLDKTFIRAPVTGVVVRKRIHVGESVSPEVPYATLFTIADTSTLRVRVDVDETDVGKIRLGQRAYVTADAYSDHKFWGQVVRIGQVLGKKNIRTNNPAERVDTKILETLVELDSNQGLPLGLRVDAFILVNHSPAEVAITNR